MSIIREQFCRLISTIYTSFIDMQDIDNMYALTRGGHTPVRELFTEQCLVASLLHDHEHGQFFVSSLSMYSMPSQSLCAKSTGVLDTQHCLSTLCSLYHFLLYHQIFKRTDLLKHPLSNSPGERSSACFGQSRTEFWYTTLFAKKVRTLRYHHVFVFPYGL